MDDPRGVPDGGRCAPKSPFRLRLPALEPLAPAGFRSGPPRNPIVRRPSFYIPPPHPPTLDASGPPKRRVQDRRAAVWRSKRGEANREAPKTRTWGRIGALLVSLVGPMWPRPNSLISSLRYSAIANQHQAFRNRRNITYEAPKRGNTERKVDLGRDSLLLVFLVGPLFSMCP